MHVIFAQSLGEYGGLSALMSGVQQLTYDISTRLGNVSATQWIIVAIAIVGLRFLMRRR